MFEETAKNLIAEKIRARNEYQAATREFAKAHKIPIEEIKSCIECGARAVIKDEFGHFYCDDCARDNSVGPFAPTGILAESPTGNVSHGKIK